MQIIRACLIGLSAVLGAWMTFLAVYQLILGLFGFTKKTKDYADHDPASRFLVLVPAHNEERVIADIIQNLQQMDYPKELYDFFIIADNCTDHTAETARGLGAQVIETRSLPGEAVGKPVALKKALETIGDYRSQYDLMMIFDADNLMDTNMFREVNSQYLDKGKPNLIQCYLGVKNKQGLVAWIDYVAFTMSNRFFMLAKQHMGINAAIGGTGYAITTDYLEKRGGWSTMSLTEDFEIQVEATLGGNRILWNHNTRVYDEKPTRLRASIRQKIRWGQGYWYVISHNMGKLWRSFLTGKLRALEFVSTLTHMCNITAYPCLILQVIANAAVQIIDGQPPFGGTTLFSVVWAALLVMYSYLFLFFMADWKDNHIRFSLKRLPFMIAGFFTNMLICFCNQTVGLLRSRDQGHWAKTEHGLTMGKEENAQSRKERQPSCAWFHAGHNQKRP